MDNAEFRESPEGLREEVADLRAHIAKLEIALATVTAERDVGRVVPELTDEEVDAYLWDRNHGLVDSDEDWVRWSRRLGKWAYALAASRLSPPSVPGGA